MRNTKLPTNRRKRRVIMRATSRSCARRSRSASFCSGPRRRRSRVITTPLTRKYQLASLTQRVDDCQMPLIRIVDLRQERRKKKRAAILSEKLRTAITSSARKTRTDHSLSQSARIFHFIALQQLRRSARLPELQRRAHISSRVSRAELSSLRAHRGRAKEMSGVRPGRVDLCPASERKKWRRTSRRFFRTRWSGGWTPIR